MIKVGDFVTRNSHNNDILFKVIEIDNDICYLKGINIRLCADSNITDLKKEKEVYEDDTKYLRLIDDRKNILNRDDYFYLPGKILHIDGDSEYLERCLNYYKNSNIMSIGFTLKEEDIPKKIYNYLEKYNPSIVVITGHDSYNNKGIDDSNNYKNSINFINAVKEARRYEKSHNKLIVIAGACQSNYEELIKAGANFAASPKRINIHALDPAIIASQMSLSDINTNIDLKKIIENTKYGSDGIGGIITNGTMYRGYPR